MVDPLSAAASGASRALAGAATKRLVSRSGTKLGSRDERRHVYARFQDATVESMGWALRCRLQARTLSPRWMGPGTQRVLADETRSVSTELMKAYMELCLVANPEPLEAGEQLLTAVQGMSDAITVRSDEEFWEAANVVGEAQRAFVETCRDDLWYLPRWWQMYRPVWWRTRAEDRRRRRELRRAAAD